MRNITNRALVALAILGLFVWEHAYADGFPLSQYLNIQSATSPSLDPAGNEVLYRTSISGVPQIWRIPVRGGYQSQVTFDTEGVDGGWWSPADSKLMVISADVGGTERTQLYLASPYGGELQRVTEDDQAIYSFNVWSDDGSRFALATNARNKKDFDIYEYQLESGKTVELYRGTGTNSAGDYSRDGRYLLIVNMTSSANSDILLFDRTSGKTRLLTEHSGDVIYNAPAWDAEAKGFYFLTNAGREFTGLAYWPLDSATFRWMETPDGDVEQFVRSRDNTHLAWTVNENGYSRLHVRNTKRGTDIPAYRVPRGVIGGLEFSRVGNRLVFTFGSGSRPFDLWLYESSVDRLLQITFSASGGIPPRLFREPELIEYPTFDGRKIPAFWYTPAESNGKIPVIVMAHGGPEGQARPDMSGLIQFWLDRGYAVLEPNIRGSTGYGKTYLAMDNVRHRMDAINDIEKAAEWLTSRSDVDHKKLILYGGSYGGFVVLSSLTTYPERWAAGVSVVGIANFVTFLEKTGVYRRALREAEYGSLEKDRDFLVSISPMTHVDKIKAPLFLIQGANDPRVPKAESDQMAQAITARGGVVEYLLFEDEGHGLSKTKNRITAYSAMMDFLDKHALKK